MIDLFLGRIATFLEHCSIALVIGHVSTNVRGNFTYPFLQY